MTLVREDRQRFSRQKGSILAETHQPAQRIYSSSSTTGPSLLILEMVLMVDGWVTCPLERCPHAPSKKGPAAKNTYPCKGYPPSPSIRGLAPPAAGKDVIQSPSQQDQQPDQPAPRKRVIAQEEERQYLVNKEITKAEAQCSVPRLDNQNRGNQG